MEKKKNNILNTIMRGNLPIWLGAEKYLPQIMFIFVLMTAFIAINLVIDNTLHKVEENKTVLENLKSIHTETTWELTALDSAVEVEKMLKEAGSPLRIPGAKARRID